MAGWTHYGENLVINTILRGETKIFAGLLKADPGDDSKNIKEVDGISYKRIQMTFIEPNQGETYNEADISFPVAKENWDWISYVGLFDAEVGGNLLAYAALDQVKEIRAADIYKIPRAFFIFKQD